MIHLQSTHISCQTSITKSFSIQNGSYFDEPIFPQGTLSQKVNRFEQPFTRKSSRTFTADNVPSNSVKLWPLALSLIALISQDLCRLLVFT